jgi:ribosome-associated protein
MTEREYEDDFDDLPPSKSAKKREMTARQKLGEALCELSAKELARIPIEDDALLEAIDEARRISAHSALRRHRQYIGKLMRRIDPEPIQTALDALYEERRGSADAFHELEELRDALLARGDDALAAVLARFPQAERQVLRSLAREARRHEDDERGKAPRRKLFRYLRELRDGEPD